MIPIIIMSGYSLFIQAYLPIYYANTQSFKNLKKTGSGSLGSGFLHIMAYLWQQLSVSGKKKWNPRYEMHQKIKLDLVLFQTELEEHFRNFS